MVIDVSSSPAELLSDVEVIVLLHHPSTKLICINYCFMYMYKIIMLSKHIMSTQRE